MCWVGSRASAIAPRISKYERGVNFPKFETIEQLAEALDLPPAYFLTQSNELARAILHFAGLPPAKQHEALEVLAELALMDQGTKTLGKGKGAN